MKNRLLPAFDALYPSKKMIIVMDNASYHRPRDFDWITPYKMTKPECASFLESQGLMETTVQCEDGSTAVFPKRTWRLHGRNKRAPLLEDLQAAVKSHLQQHPAINKTKIDKLLQPLGHSIVWTPPFVPEVQPIELIWAYVKTLVAQQYTLRNIDVTRSQTDDAVQSITPEMIQKRIRRCHKWIDGFMQTEEAGSLRAFSSLDKLVTVDSSTAIPTDIESASIEDELVSSDDGMDEE